jgi:hypothetical protein
MSNDNLRAFELRPEYKMEDLNGATVAFGPMAAMFDIKAALEDGSGKIVTDDSLMADTLAGHHILVECDVPSKASQFKLATVPDTGITVQAGGGGGWVSQGGQHEGIRADAIPGMDLPAEHQDEQLDTPDDVIQQGEAVSGATPFGDPAPTKI